MLQTLLDTYYCIGWLFPNPMGERTEWRIHRYGYDEDLWYITYRKAARLADPKDCPWIWSEWYEASKEDCQQWFKQKKPIMKNMTATEVNNNWLSLAHNEPKPDPYNNLKDFVLKYYGDGAYYHAQEEKPMRALSTIPCTSTGTTAQLTGIAVTGSIEAPKTDTQTQREYLLERHHGIDSSVRWGEISGKMQEAFAIHVDNRPKTAKELFDGITSGKFTLKADEAARQEIMAAKYGRVDFYDDLFDAVDWGGLKPDRAGYETARDKAIDDLKAARDTIMIGDPADGLKALQALEAWTPPTQAS